MYVIQTLLYDKPHWTYSQLHAVDSATPALRFEAYKVRYSAEAFNHRTHRPMLSGVFIPATQATLAAQFSEQLANFAPQITLDFISEFYILYKSSTPHEEAAHHHRHHLGLTNEQARNVTSTPGDPRRHYLDGEKISRRQKSACLQYLSPWIRNMAFFSDPAHPLFDGPGGEHIAFVIRQLVDITVRDHEVSLSSLVILVGADMVIQLLSRIHSLVWAEINQLDINLVSDIVLEELVTAATDAGPGSSVCEAVANVFTVLTSLNIRAKLLGRLRRVSSCQLCTF